MRFIGGSSGFPNSVFYDTIVVVYDRVDLVALGGEWNKNAGGTTAKVEIRYNNVSNEDAAPVVRAYWAKSAAFTPSSIIREIAYFTLIEEGVIRAANFVDGECALENLPALFRDMSEGNRAVKTFVRTQV